MPKAARLPDQGPDEKEKAKEREGKEETGRQQRAKKERRLSPWAALNSRTPAQGRCSEQHGGGPGGARGQGRLGVESLDGALDGDQHGVAVAILGLGGGDLHPTFADAVLLDIGALLAVHANADLVLETLRHMVRAARVGRQTVGQCRFVVAHFIDLSVIKSGSL